MKDGSIRWINVGGGKEVDVHAGDRIMLCTPGGGGYGPVGGEATEVEEHKQEFTAPIPRGNGSLREYERNQQASN